MTKGKFALGALIGAAVGAAAGVVTGLLTAPKSGKETRADLKIKKDKLQKQAAQEADKLATQAKTAAADVKTKAEKTVNDTKAMASDLKTRTENAVEGAKKGFNKKP